MTGAAFVTAAPAYTNTAFSGTAICASRPAASAKWTMGKNAKFGPFTPAVVATRLVIGEKNLNKIRGKGIALHSQAITAFCEFTGAGPKMRAGLIRTAKENGDGLGFLS